MLLSCPRVGFYIIIINIVPVRIDPYPPCKAYLNQVLGNSTLV
jgi:hypothetical protein